MGESPITLEELEQTIDLSAQGRELCAEAIDALQEDAWRPLGDPSEPEPDALRVLRDWLEEHGIAGPDLDLVALLCRRWKRAMTPFVDRLDRGGEEESAVDSDLRDLAAVLAHTGPGRLRAGRFEIQPDVPAGAATLVRWNDGMPRSGVWMPVETYPIPESHRDEGWVRWVLRELTYPSGAPRNPLR